MRGKINRGRRHERVYIYEIVVDHETTWYPIETKMLKEWVYAEVRSVSTKEFMESMSPSSTTQTYKFVMPRLGYLTTGDEIEWNDKAWNIQHIHYIDKWDMEITAKYVGAVNESAE